MRWTKQILQMVWVLAVAVSLAGSVAVGVLWWRSYHVEDFCSCSWANVSREGDVFPIRYLAAESAIGVTRFVSRYDSESGSHDRPVSRGDLQRRSFWLAPRPLKQGAIASPFADADSAFHFHGFGYGSRTSPGSRSNSIFRKVIVLPTGALFLLTLLPPLVYFTKSFRRARRRAGIRRGLCGFCGYDLRASGDRCPECGRSVDEGRGELRPSYLSAGCVGVVSLLSLTCLLVAGAFSIPGPPAAATNLNVRVRDGYVADASWSATAVEHTRYRVEYTVAGGSKWKTPAMREIGPTATVIFNLEDATSYDFRVIGKNVFGESPPSEIVTITTPLAPPPRMTMAKAMGPKWVELRWEFTSEIRGPTHVQRASEGGEFTSVAITGLPKARQMTDVGVEGGRTYRYRARVETPRSASKWSEPIMVETPAK